jgi:hypothetical protein
MHDMRRNLLAAFFGCFSFSLLASPSFAEDKSFYSPVIQVDTENHRVLISTFGAVFWVDAPDAAKPHLEKLPVSGLVDFVVEMRGNEQTPLLKTWKVKSGETSCKHFDGNACK